MLAIQKTLSTVLLTSLLLTAMPAFAADDFAMSRNERYFQEVALKWGQLAKQDPVAQEQPAILKAGIKAYENDYRLGAGDQLKINIPNFDLVSPSSVSENYKTTNYEISLTVGPNGMTTIPSFGTFDVDGMTLSQFSDMLKEMAGVYLVEPKAYVTLHKSRPFTIGVLGEVAHPGLYQVSVGEGIKDPARPYSEETGNYTFQTDYFPRVSSAIKRAGGFLTVSDLENVSIKNDKTGRQLTLNLRRMILDGDLSQDVQLEPGDVVSIPKNISANNTVPAISASTLSPDTYPIRILGYVNRASVGIVSLDSRSLTLANALNEINVDPSVNLKKVLILRKAPDSMAYTTHTVNAMKEDFQLQPDDTIMLSNRKTWAKLRDIAQTVIQPAGSFSLGIATWLR